MTAACEPETIHPGTPSTRDTPIRSAAGAFIRHRALFAATAGLVLFATFIVTISLTPAYRSESTLVLRNAEPRTLGSLQEILRSREVAESLVDPEWPTTPPAQHTGAEIRQHERAIAAFGRSLEVSPSAEAGSLRVAYVAETPNQAADILGQLIEEAAERLQRMEPAASSRQSNPVMPPTPVPATPSAADPVAADPAAANPAAAEALRSRIAAIDTARRAAETQLAGTADRVAAQKHDLAILSPWVLGDVNPAYKQGKEKLAASIAQLAALRSRIVGLSAQRANLSRQLAEAKATPAAPVQAPAAPLSAPPPRPAVELVVTERPTLPARPIRPRPLLNFLVGLIAACVFGLCSVVFAEWSRRRRSPGKPEEVATMPLLATIPYAAPRSQLTYGALALSPGFRVSPGRAYPEREEPQPSAGLFSVAPAQPPLAPPAPAARLVLEPLEPAPRLPARGLGNAPLPARSRLTPSQRAQLRRSAPPPDPEGRGYVTYTIEAKH